AIGTQPRELDERESQIMAQLAALAESELELRRTADVDALTETLTRRAFKRKAEELANDRRSSNLPISAIIFDLDHFKAVNDTFGHAGGDTVLSTIARVCKAELRARMYLVVLAARSVECSCRRLMRQAPMQSQKSFVRR